jgi:hypothetical protein
MSSTIRWNKPHNTALVCRKIMNARNEIRRQTIQALVGTAETKTKSENLNITNISKIFLLFLFHIKCVFYFLI